MIKVGDIVNYHAKPGGPVTSEGHEILYINPGLDVHNRQMVRISERIGLIPNTQLSNKDNPMKKTMAAIKRKKILSRMEFSCGKRIAKREGF